jgi:phospholipase/carboxylesterase
MSLFEGLRYPDPLAGIMVLSGHALLHETHEAEQAEANRATPMLFCHGRYDPVVPVTLGRSAYEACAEGRDARWHELPIEHSVSMEEIELIAGWLKERLEPSS